MLAPGQGRRDAGGSARGSGGAALRAPHSSPCSSESPDGQWPILSFGWGGEAESLAQSTLEPLTKGSCTGLHHQMALWPWASGFPSLNLRFLICESDAPPCRVAVKDPGDVRGKRPKLTSTVAVPASVPTLPFYRWESKAQKREIGDVWEGRPFPQL